MMYQKMRLQILVFSEYEYKLSFCFGLPLNDTTLMLF